MNMVSSKHGIDNKCKKNVGEDTIKNMTFTKFGICKFRL